MARAISIRLEHSRNFAARAGEGILAIALDTAIFLIFFATVHGYGAAWLAVRMLFRPRRPLKLWGVTVWPQGMIPRHRERLAQTIGNAVGNELVSQETVVDALFATDFLRRKIETFVNTYSEELLESNYPSLIEALPRVARAPVLDSISALQRRVGEYIAELLRSEQTAESVREFVDRRVDELLARRLSDTVDTEIFAQIIGFIEGRLRGIVTEQGFEQKVRDFIGERVEELAHSSATLGEIFTPEAVEIVKERIDRQVPPIVHQLALIATSRRTRAQIGTLIKREVDDYYAQLSFFKKIFISRERIHDEVDDLVNKTLPRRVEEFLHGAAFEQEAKSFLNATIDDWLSRPINELVGQIEPERLAYIKEQLADRALALARSPELAEGVSAYVSEAVNRLRPHTLRALLQHIKPASAPRLKALLTRALLDVMTREETARSLNAMISAQIERFLIKPIGRPVDLMPAGSIERAGTALTERIVSAARERLPAAITEFDIGGIVRRKVADYPEEKLEALVLSVAKQHLRTIEMFGAAIGFFLGVGQVLYLAYAEPVVGPWLRGLAASLRSLLS